MAYLSIKVFDVTAAQLIYANILMSFSLLHTSYFDLENEHVWVVARNDCLSDRVGESDDRCVVELSLSSTASLCIPRQTITRDNDKSSSPTSG